jgi:PAS domain S-box-containing protein
MKNKPTILIIDDEETNVEILAERLTEDFNIKVSFDGMQGIEVLNKFNNIDLILLDIHMPKMNGFEVAEKIIQNEKIAHIPFIFLTADSSEETISQSFNMGALDFIIKPLDMKTFNQKIKVYLKYIQKNKENETNLQLVGQYKYVIDETSIVSKADLNGIITYVNDKFCEISGFKREELIGKPHSIVRHPNTDSTVFEYLWYTIKNLKQTWTGEIQNKKKDGSSYWVQATISPILNQNGEIIEFIGIRTDITQQQKIKEYFENQLKISTKQFDSALYITKQYEECLDQKDAILRTNTDNNITFANENFCKVSGFSLDELIGVNCSTLRDSSHIEAGDCDRIKQELSNKKIVSMVFKNISKNNKEYYMDTVVYPIQDIDGNTIEHLHLMNNITQIVELNHEIEETQKEVVFTMGAIGETRSKETGLHVKRVAEYSYLLAKLYGLDEETATLLKQASPMHDIGKVGIRDSILNKAGKLTKDEFEIMKTHAEIGFEMLKHSNRSILKTAATVSFTHHEKFDGSGYPRGLKGEDIPIEGRITAIADVFDALGHDRIYKKAWELDRILELFKEEKAKHFDPTLIDLFLNNLDKFLEIKKSLEDDF